MITIKSIIKLSKFNLKDLALKSGMKPRTLYAKIDKGYELRADDAIKLEGILKSDYGIIMEDEK